MSGVALEVQGDKSEKRRVGQMAERLFQISNAVDVGITYEPTPGDSEGSAQGKGTFWVSHYGNNTGLLVTKSASFTYVQKGDHYTLQITDIEGVKLQDHQQAWSEAGVEQVVVATIQSHEQAQHRAAVEAEPLRVEQARIRSGEVSEATSSFSSRDVGGVYRDGDADAGLSSSSTLSIANESILDLGSFAGSDLPSLPDADTSFSTAHSAQGGIIPPRKPDPELGSFGGLAVKSFTSTADLPGGREDLSRSQSVSRVKSFFKMLGAGLMVIGSAVRLLVSPVEALVAIYVGGGGMGVFPESFLRLQDWVRTTARAARELTTGESIDASYEPLRSEHDAALELDSSSPLGHPSPPASPRLRTGSLSAARSAAASSSAPLDDAGITVTLDVAAEAQHREQPADSASRTPRGSIGSGST
jgi:hypothetical protein